MTGIAARNYHADAQRYQRDEEGLHQVHRPISHYLFFPAVLVVDLIFHTQDSIFEVDWG